MREQETQYMLCTCNLHVCVQGVRSFQKSHFFRAVRPSKQVFISMFVKHQTLKSKKKMLKKKQSIVLSFVSRWFSLKVTELNMYRQIEFYFKVQPDICKAYKT